MPASGPPRADRRPDRYPTRRAGRPVLIALVAVVAAVGLGWLGWAAWGNSQPKVSGAVNTWKINSDSEVSFTLTVDRRDPGVPAACRVKAQAANYEVVGEREIRLDPGQDRLLDVTETMRTLRRATSVSLDECWVPTG